MITNVRAAYFEKLPYTIKQPNGITIKCFVSGDEFFNWIHDEQGYTIIQAPNGYYYYAEQKGDIIQPTKYLVNSVNPARVGLKKWAKISKAEYQRKYDAMFAFKKTESINNSGPNRAPHSGVLNNLIIYIRFSDDTEFTTSRQVYDDKFNPTTGVSLKSYYKEVSYNNLTISSTHYPSCELTTNLSYQDSHSRNYFLPYNATTNPTGYSGGGNGEERRIREHQLLVDAINWINFNSPVSSALNIDGDGDDNVDNVCFIIKGSSGGWNDLLWAHRWTLFSQNVYINGKKVYDYTFQPEGQVAVMTICHEMFHSLGAPDLYHYTSNGIAPVSSWDLMESGGGHMLAYMKWKYSNHTWINTIPEITTTGTYTLNPVTSSNNNCYKIASPFSTDEYFMIEYRNKSGTFESSIPGSGLIIYRIDESVTTGNRNGPPDEVYVYRPNGTITSNGAPNNAFFSSTIGRTAINDTTNPKCFLQNGTKGGINISNISTAGTTISFNVTFPPPCNSPAIQASAFTSSTLTDNSMTIGWTRGTGDSVLIIAKAGSATTILPYAGNTYTANAIFGLGTQLGTGNYVVYNGTGTSVNITALTQGTTYYYAIYEYNSSEHCYKKPALTAIAATTGFCLAGAISTNPNGEYISNVSIGSINQASSRGTSGYQNFTSQITNMQIGVNTAATISCTNSYSADQLFIWVDWNHDNDFTDAGEAVYSSSGTFVSPHTTTSFTAPPNALPGTTRMRIRLDDADNGPNPFPCGNAEWGEVEDYTINVIATPNTTFTATLSNAWENAANWDHGIPDTTTNATIAAIKLAIVNSNNYQCKNLTIAPLGKLTINAGKDLTVKDSLVLTSDATGSASLIDYGTLHSSTNIVERYIPHIFTDEFHMLSSPVVSQAISSVFNEPDGFFVWNEPTGNWIDFADATNFAATNGGSNFIPAKGYAVSYPTATTKSFTGNLNTGTINIPLSVTAGLYCGWNFVANPYPSAINWNASSGWNRSMLENADPINHPNEKAIWVWNAQLANYGTYISNTNTATNGVSRNIALSQGFWVKATTAVALEMNNEVREHAEQGFLKSSSTDELIRLKVSSTVNAYSDELIIGFGNSNAQGGAEKMFSINATAPSIYSCKQNKNWSISNLTSIADNAMIPIGFKPGVDGNYTISAMGVQALGNVILEDLKIGVQQNLSINNNYLFNAQTSDNENRFLLNLTTSGINNMVDKKPSINYSNQTINVFNPWLGKTTLYIYDAAGKLVESLTVKEGNGNYSCQISKGVYIFKLQHSKHQFVKKEVIF
ncbi:MAG: M6 family metalloprotease domain-containing protein [Bacteroidales bacterium]